MPVTWNESWQISASITIRTGYILRLMAIHRQNSPVKPPSTTQLSAISIGNRIVEVYISYLLLPDYEFAIHRVAAASHSVHSLIQDRP
jgi:hypothetical protein